MSPLLRFYRGEGKDARGRTLADILAWDDARLEAVHDYIQWVFPLPEPSGFNPDAPLLTPQDIAAFRAEPALRRPLLAAQQRMQHFYRLPAASGERFAAPWLTPANHNFLRITRILRSLTLLGLGDVAREMLAKVEAAVQSGNHSVVGLRTLDFWRAAVLQD